MEYIGIIVCSVKDVINKFCELKSKNNKGYICDFYSKTTIENSRHYFKGCNINKCIINFVEEIYKNKRVLENKDDIESGYIFFVREYFGKEYICLDSDKILKMFEYELENWIISINWFQEFDTEDGRIPNIDKYIQKCFKIANFYNEKFALVNNYRVMEDIACNY